MQMRIKKKLNKMLMNQSALLQIKSIMRELSPIVIREYKLQTPVDKGGMRDNVEAQYIENGLGFIVTTKANVGGYRYPIVVHEGLGKYMGKADRGYVSGYTRENNYSEKEIALFRVIAWRAKRQGKKGASWPMDIRPNKFAKRAMKISMPLVIKYAVKRFNDVGIG